MNQIQAEMDAYKSYQRDAAIAAAIGCVFFGSLTVGITAFLYWGYLPGRELLIDTPGVLLVLLADLGGILIVGLFFLSTVVLFICGVAWGMEVVEE